MDDTENTNGNPGEQELEDAALAEQPQELNAPDEHETPTAEDQLEDLGNDVQKSIDEQTEEANKPDPLL